MKKQLLLSTLALAGLSVTARAQTPVTVIDWSHSWKFVHPLGALPGSAGNFITTWYKPDAEYSSGITFGASPEFVGVAATATSYDSGNGRSILGYGGVDFVANAASGFTAVAEPSLLTTPNSGRRYSAYYKTTFTVPAGGIQTPKFEFLCDDGGFVYLDGNLIATINMTDAATDTYTQLAEDATMTEADSYVLDLSVAPGVQNPTGRVTATNTMNVKLLTQVESIAAGVHTLAVSVHNSAIDSSDLAFAAKLTALSNGCNFTASTGAVSRNLNGTPSLAADDLLEVSVTVNAGTNNAPTWNMSASAPGVPANPTSGAYGATSTFSFPVSTIVGGAVTLTFSDANDASCVVPVTVSLPLPPYILGKKRINGVESDLYSSLPMPTSWQNATPRVFTCNGTGGNRATQEFRSETLDLTGLARPVTIVATFRANETSAGSNFEAADNFSAEAILDGGAPVSMLAADLDRGDGASSHVAVDGLPQENGPLNGWLNGYTQIVPVNPPNTAQTAIENYNDNIIRDEFNYPPADLPAPQPVPADASLDRTFQITYTVPDTANSLVLSFKGGNDSTSEFFTLSGIRVYNGACDMQAAATNVTRDLGVQLDDPSDDMLHFSLLVSGSGSAWTFGANSGVYGAASTLSIPASQSGIPQSVADSIDPACSTTFTITAPPAPLIVTSTQGQGTTFSAAVPPGGAATSYTRPAGGTELGWSGGDADVQALAQPDPNTTARYLDLNGKTPAGDFLTEPVIIASSVPYVKVRVDLGAYTTSGSGFEDDDVILIVAEASPDISFPAASTTSYTIYGTPPLGTTGGAEFYNLFKVAQPEAMNYGTTVAFPSADFPLVRQEVVFDRGSNVFVRLRISGGVTAATSEHALVDNIFFELGACKLSVASTSISHDNKGDNDPANDEFSASVTINGVATGASSSWTTAGAPGTGTYGAPVVFGPYPVSGGPVTVEVADSLESQCKTSFTLTPPVCSLSIDATAVESTVSRNTNGTTSTVNDDTISFEVTVTGTSGGTGWISNIPNPAEAGTFFSGTYGAPVSITLAYPTLPVPVVLRDAADEACRVSYTVPVPHEGIFNLGTLVPLTGAAQPVLSLAVPAPGTPAAATWTNPADGAVAMNNPVVTPAPDPLIYTVDSAGITNPAGFKEVLFTANLVVLETSAGSNFEAADRFRIMINYELAEGGSGARNVIATYDANGDGYMSGQDDTAGSYDANPTGDEFNRPAPGVNMAGSISHTFPLSAVVPAGATLITFSIEGYNNSASEHYRVENILLTERLEDPNADTDGDGVSNLNEGIMGTLPNDPNSVTRLARSSAAPNQFTFDGVAGRFYRVYISDDAAVPSHLTKWKDAGLGSLSGAGAHTVTITPEAGVPRRFYRLHVRESDVDWPAVVPAP